MTLTEEHYQKIRSELESCENPLILFHDDADGLSSFLLLRRFMGKGIGEMVKPVPVVDSSYLPIVTEHNPDKIFIVDIAVVEQEFIDGVKVPIIWIDHHMPLERKGVQYFNPRLYEPHESQPATYVCYHAVKQDVWIGMVGTIGDWYVPEFATDFAEHYPELFDATIKNPDEALFTTQVGTLVRMFNFALKGAIEDAKENVALLTNITDPYELLNQESDPGKKLYTYFAHYLTSYDELLDRAQATDSDAGFFVFTYTGKDSFTSELSNEMLFLRPQDVIIVGREKDDAVRMSVRGSGKNVILPRLQKALAAVGGSGGGHEYACGASVKKVNFDTFLESFKQEF